MHTTSPNPIVLEYHWARLSEDFGALEAYCIEFIFRAEHRKPIYCEIILLHNTTLLVSFMSFIVYLVFPVSDVESDFDFRPYVSELYDCTLMRLRAADIDQEVKERAISCMWVRVTSPVILGFFAYIFFSIFCLLFLVFLPIPRFS